ncbi:hypothetical protein DTO013E5_1203 [Penicillium roqueforti]|uniref:Genomic scaffold, ProqFM164S01 n=1 Tax=Penicillium roqueforti (strain FM164) TaxID=1365484 RepID=W6Q4B6_PENRF|nr:uncharacterized protein LCP9604111_2359 [Penicillium roqueforti]CDM29009.1 unnamed protein product [Penicillium roqueforti FM164]KAF9252363.1 hypothetical protein LCP9604111_2359 [Penicillium roqueforti]KAI1837633.1 hypothetical protein CBS147337_1916 [Penicillium roqueforti]KAI2682491.1 hypothetical protein LCP963914a_6379 [Penicillium roqueforti]KAI2682821.1 hypothetical protein CBS147355_1961 [Penicillium roqueforti]
MSSRAGLASRQAAGSQIRQAPPLNPPRSYLRVPLDTPITPLVSCHGNSHINFPKTIKDYYQLDSMTLDSLMVFFSQIRPETADTRRYPTIVAPWLTWDYEREGWQTDVIDIESKRCRFGEFIGLTDELVDPKLLNLRRLHAERDKPVQTPSGETPSGAGAVQRPMMRREKRKGLFRRLPFGK